jgi:hypothetical protein
MRGSVGKWAGARTAALFPARHLRSTSTSHDTLWALRAARGIRGARISGKNAFWPSTSKVAVKIQPKGVGRVLYEWQYIIYLQAMMRTHCERTPTPYATSYSQPLYFCCTFFQCDLSSGLDALELVDVSRAARHNRKRVFTPLTHHWTQLLSKAVSTAAAGLYLRSGRGGENHI